MRRLAGLLLLGAIGGGCSIDKKTAAFRCEIDQDCDADRRCELRLSSSTFPVATIRPWSMITTSSQMSSTRSSW